MWSLKIEVHPHKRASQFLKSSRTSVAPPVQMRRYDQMAHFTMRKYISQLEMLKLLLASTRTSSPCQFRHDVVFSSSIPLHRALHSRITHAQCPPLETPIPRRWPTHLFRKEPGSSVCRHKLGSSPRSHDPRRHAIFLNQRHRLQDPWLQSQCRASDLRYRDG